MCGPSLVHYVSIHIRNVFLSYFVWFYDFFFVYCVFQEVEGHTMPVGQFEQKLNFSTEQVSCTLILF